MPLSRIAQLLAAAKRGFLVRCASALGYCRPSALARAARALIWQHWNGHEQKRPMQFTRSSRGVPAAGSSSGRLARVSLVPNQTAVLQARALISHPTHCSLPAAAMPLDLLVSSDKQPKLSFARQQNSAAAVSSMPASTAPPDFQTKACPVLSPCSSFPVSCRSLAAALPMHCCPHIQPTSSRAPQATATATFGTEVSRSRGARPVSR